VDFSVQSFARRRGIVLPPGRQHRDPTSFGLGRTGCAAFTLVEVVFAVAIVGILVIALYAAIAVSAGSVRVGQEDQRVTQILTEKLDTIRLYNWDQINSNGFIRTNFTAAIDPLDTNSLTYYTGSVSIVQAPIDEAYKSNLLQVTVNVEWMAGYRLQSRSMSTYVARYGLQTYIMR
jgi:prepilin-type N-terminal cleavage/methylation domain-containing protein